MSNNATIYGWVSSGNDRGTMDIIWDCLVTIGLCCWTAVCVNVPTKREKHWVGLLNKLGLACLGMLGPDFLLLLAYSQWRSAKASVVVRVLQRNVSILTY